MRGGGTLLEPVPPCGSDEACVCVGGGGFGDLHEELSLEASVYAHGLHGAGFHDVVQGHIRSRQGSLTYPHRLLGRGTKKGLDTGGRMGQHRTFSKNSVLPADHRTKPDPKSKRQRGFRTTGWKFHHETRQRYGGRITQYYRCIDLSREKQTTSENHGSKNS